MLKQIEEMKELGMPSIIVSTRDDVLLLLGEAKHKLKFFKDSGGLFGHKFFWELLLELKKSSEMTFLTHGHTYILLFANYL